jgi:hypothetical protein
VSESVKVLPNLNKTSGSEMHIRQIYKSFAVLEDIHRSANGGIDGINTFESLLLLHVTKLYFPLI